MGVEVVEASHLEVVEDVEDVKDFEDVGALWVVLVGERAEVAVTTIQVAVVE